MLTCRGTKAGPDGAGNVDRNVPSSLLLPVWFGLLLLSGTGWSCVQSQVVRHPGLQVSSTKGPLPFGL